MRENWDNYFMKIAEDVAERATCDRLHVGCIIVRDKRIIACGYNGSISNDEHCEDVGCKVVENHCVRTVHAEMNAFLQCARFGIATDGAVIYITHFPCLSCTKAIIQAGIEKIYYLNSYNDNEYAMELLRKSGVAIRKVK